MILTSAALAILVTMTLAITRALLGPTIYDRILAVNMFGTKTVLLIAVIAAIAGRGDYLDIALVYAMINFVAIIAVMKYFEFGSLGHDGHDEAAVHAGKRQEDE
ncbi:MAG: monovalent cation/H+ antiporter complex subunit F [Pseudohongiella sp.]|uniref:monovalent cation/H+ antiporter complex subunit F n=1 Tax=Pseudohongiella sp. TaxID=1979412 RepID=UPI0034A02AD1